MRWIFPLMLICIAGLTRADTVVPVAENTAIVEELSLPPVKIHCSVLAEDAIQSAIADYKAKQGQENEEE